MSLRHNKPDARLLRRCLQSDPLYCKLACHFKAAVLLSLSVKCCICSGFAQSNRPNCVCVRNDELVFTCKVCSTCQNGADGQRLFQGTENSTLVLNMNDMNIEGEDGNLDCEDELLINHDRIEQAPKQ